MKKTNYLRFLKIGIFFLGISLFVLGCQQEDKSLENNQTSDFDTPFKTITYQKAINKKTFKTITENSKIKTFFETNNYKSKSNSKEQNYSVVKETVKIIEKKDYISYTFLLNNNEKSTNSSFSNLVIEKKKKAIRAYIINYIPSQEFLTSKNKPFSGRISVKRIEYDETLLSRESDCGWVDNYTRRNCTVHGTSGIYNPQCSNYGKDAFSYSSSFVCDLNGGGSIGNLTYFSNDNSTGGSNSADEDKSSTQTAPIFPCGDEIHGCDKEREDEGVISNKLTNICAKKIFTEIENGIYKEDPIKPEVDILVNNTDKLNFIEEILLLFANSKKTHLSIQDGTTSGTNATTKGSDITLNKNYISKATKLSIVRTMIHESIHVYLNAYYYKYPDFNDKPFTDKLRKYASDNGFSDMNRFQHEFMGQYVDAIAVSLYEWDKEYGSGKNNNTITKPDDLLGWNYYRSMAFGGLFFKDSNNEIQETDSFKALIPDQKDRDNIVKILENEQNGNKDAKGAKC